MREAEWKEFWDRCSTPRRVVWAVAEHDGKRSVCPLGWKMHTSHDPPMVAISVAPSRFTHSLIDASGEFVLAWPGEDLAQATLTCGTTSGRDVEKFADAGLTAQQGKFIGAPLVTECVANLECWVTGKLDTGDHTIFAGEVLATWVSDAPGRLQCVVDDASGYDVLAREGGWTIGAVRE